MSVNSHILPHILATLSRKPDSGDNIDNLCDEVEDIVASENPDGSTTHIRQDITKALEVAQGLGIISLTNKKIRLPFSFGGNQKRAPEIVDDALDESMDDSMDDDAPVETAVKSSRRKGSPPRKRAPLTEDDSQYRMMVPKKSVAMDRMGRRRSAKARRPRRGRASSRGKVSRRRVSRRRR